MIDQGADANEVVRALGEAVFTGDENAAQELLFRTRDVVAALVRERDLMRPVVEAAVAFTNIKRRGSRDWREHDFAVDALFDSTSAYIAATAPPSGGQEGGG